MEYSICKKLKSKIVREDLEKNLGVKVKEIFIASSDVEEMKFYVDKAYENHFQLSESPPFSRTDNFSLYVITSSNNSIVKLLDNSGYFSSL